MCLRSKNTWFKRGLIDFSQSRILEAVIIVCVLYKQVFCVQSVWTLYKGWCIVKHKRAAQESLKSKILRWSCSIRKIRFHKDRSDADVHRFKRIDAWELAFGYEKVEHVQDTRSLQGVRYCAKLQLDWWYTCKNNLEYYEKLLHIHHNALGKSRKYDLLYVAVSVWALIQAMAVPSAGAGQMGGLWMLVLSVIVGVGMYPSLKVWSVRAYLWVLRVKLERQLNKYVRLGVSSIQRLCDEQPDQKERSMCMWSLWQATLERYDRCFHMGLTPLNKARQEQWKQMIHSCKVLKGVIFEGRRVEQVSCLRQMANPYIGPTFSGSFIEQWAQTYEHWNTKIQRNQLEQSIGGSGWENRKQERRL